ncbi:unnamed protein product [Linum tenue]|uniref:Phototropic-responsive NPH3 family protein n=1 Tax=Linum tenue TaxID=586396 RepID=A0AAV0N2D8_9ROSI|nr:unnamed protein product [Linum tenue]
MASAGKVTAFRREGNEWFCQSGLPSDIIVTVDGVQFNLHKFPLVSKCGKISEICEASPDKKTLITELEEFPGGPDPFLIAVKFCYGMRVELSPRNIVMIYCAADYLQMTEELGEGNLLSKSENFLHKNVLQNWKDCILALQSCNPVLPNAEQLGIITKCLNAISLMVSTDPSLFGCPMMICFSDVNLKPGKIRSLAEALPESSRPFHDGLYRALDIYFKAHPWLPEREKEELCNIIDYQKLSIDACSHGSQNERLPHRTVLQVLYFEQMQLRTALAGCLHVFDTESRPEPAGPLPGQIVQRDMCVTVVRENQVLKGDMENMKSRVGELEEEFSRIKQGMRRR